MPRAKLLERPRKLTLHMPEEVMVRLDLFLVSSATGKIPVGAYSAFLVDRINEFFAKQAANPQPQE